MVKTIGYVYCLIFLWVNAFHVCAQNSNLKFEYLTINDGLSNNRISSFLRDSKGYLWIGTVSGLNKYDGNSIVSYLNTKQNSKKTGALSANDITCIFEDNTHTIWIGTASGLNIYNPLNDSFKVLNESQNSGKFIGSIYQDKRGSIWVISDGDNILKKWLPAKKVFIDYVINNFTNNRPSKYKNLIAEDSKGNLWIGSTGKGIYRFETKTEKFTNFDDPSIDFNPNVVKSIYIDAKDKIWLAEDHCGFMSFDPASKKFKKFGTKGDTKGTNGNIFFNIIGDDTNHLLIAVDQGGINRFDKTRQSFEYFRHDSDDKTGLNNNGIWQLYKDKEGILWVGTSGAGVNYFNPKKHYFKSYSHTANNNQSVCYNNILHLFEDSRGFIWIGTDGGLSRFDPKTGTFKNYNHNPSNPYSLSSDVIICITEDKNNDLWMGTWEHGLIKYERKKDNFYNYLADNNNPLSISGNSIWAIKTDYLGRIWISVWDSGIDVFDPGKGVIQRYRPNAKDQTALLDSRINCFYEDPWHNMWLCTWKGLNLFDRNRNQFIAYKKIPEVQLKSIFLDKHDNLWLGTDADGIILYNLKNKSIQTFDDSNGLPNNNISGILQDNHGIFWIASAGGITKFNIKEKSFKTYSIYDGLLGNQFKCALKSSNDELFFGGSNGINAFFPDSLRENNFLPPVYINDFQILNRSVLINTKGSPLKNVIGETREISLQPGQNVFSFGFTAINFTHPEKNEYAYKLEGFDKQWNHTSASRRYVIYTNLNPGDYTFKVIASNNDGHWNHTGTSLKITIIPPFWKTLWFRILSVAFIIVVIFGIYYWRMIQTEKMNVKLKRLVAKKTFDLEIGKQELEEKNKELYQQTEALNAINTIMEERQQQIEEQSEELTVQRDQLRQLNATKDKLFTILAHDLRNPFHVIIGFSELMLADFKKLGDEKIQRFLKLIHSSSKRSNDLLENILQWSRMQTGRITCNPEVLDLSKIVLENLYFLEGEAESKNITVKTLMENSVTVNADENMVKTILRNLLSNAIKFTPEKGSIIVEVKSNINETQISIADSGIGISGENLRNLFRIDTTITTKGTNHESGTGLGLLLCREFVERHNGKIWIESKVGKGSTVHFTIPAILIETAAS